MIAKSDVVILVISASALAAGIYRWQSNMAMMSPVQNTASAPTAAVLNGNPESPPIMANTVQSSNTVQSTTTVGVKNTSVANTGNTANYSSLGGDANTGNIANNGAQSASLAGSNLSSTEGNIQLADPLYGTYVVKSGDYLGKIAATFGTTVATLRTINNIDGSLIDVDQKILYPFPAN